MTRETDTTVIEIADGIFRLSTYLDPPGMVFNQFLVVDEEPLLFHRDLERDQLQGASRRRRVRGALESPPPRLSAMVPYIQRALGTGEGPIVAVTDHVKLVADQIGRFVPEPFVPLGTDGYGLSDTRAALRRHFEVDAPHIVVAVLWGCSQRASSRPSPCSTPYAPMASMPKRPTLAANEGDVPRGRRLV